MGGTRTLDSLQVPVRVFDSANEKFVCSRKVAPVIKATVHHDVEDRKERED